MARKKGVMDIRDIVIRLRKRESIRQIKRETGIHRTIIRKVKETCYQQGWFKQLAVPTVKEVAESFALFEKPPRPHPLDKFTNDIKRYVEEQHSFVVIHHLISERYECSESTIRRYIHSRFPKKAPVVTRREHTQGEIMEVDFGFLGLVYDCILKRNRKAWVFSARLRYSRKAYREVVFNQTQQTFFLCHIHAFEEFEGVPKKVVPDNLKAAVIKACYNDPIINRAYRSMAEYYDFLINPTLPYHPQHKGGVENDIKYVKKNFWPIFKERQRLCGHEVPYSDKLSEELINWTKSVSELRIIGGVGRTVVEMFAEEKEKLQRLPFFSWDIETWKNCKTGLDCYINFEKAYYSVPYKYRGREVIVYGNSKVVRIFLDNNELCSHARASNKWQVVKKKEHFPPSTIDYFKTTLSGLKQRSRQIGEQTLS